VHSSRVQQDARQLRPRVAQWSDVRSHAELSTIAARAHRAQRVRSARHVADESIWSRIAGESDLRWRQTPANGVGDALFG